MIQSKEIIRNFISINNIDLVLEPILIPQYVSIVGKLCYSIYSGYASLVRHMKSLRHINLAPEPTI